MAPERALGIAGALRRAGRAAAMGLVLGLALPLGAMGRPAAPPSPSAPPTEAPLPPLPLSVAVAEADDGPVVSDAWLAAQITTAGRLIAPHGLGLRQVERRSLDARFAVVDAPEDRDALAAEVKPHVVNLFVVGRLRDIDRPQRWILGVRWRLRRNLGKDYVILSTAALPTTLAHELGHYLGNPHSQVEDNVMSYRRSDPSALCFDRPQGARMRRTARRLFATERLWPATAFAPEAGALPGPP